jgi:hypothetical protein
LTSAEAEYVALCDAACDLVFVDKILSQLAVPSTYPLTLKTDAQSAIRQVQAEGTWTYDAHPRHRATPHVTNLRFFQLAHFRNLYLTRYFHLMFRNSFLSTPTVKRH